MWATSNSADIVTLLAGMVKVLTFALSVSVRVSTALPNPSTFACVKVHILAPLVDDGALRVTDVLLMLVMVTVLPCVVPIAALPLNEKLRYV